MFHAEYSILIIMICISLQYIGMSYCECSFELDKDMDPHFQPVYFIKDANKKKSYDLASLKLVKTRNHILFDEKETLIITCPNGTGLPERYYEIDITLLCGPKKPWKITKGANKITPKKTPEQYQCKIETGFYFKTESNNTDAKKQCRSMNGVLHHVGIFANLEGKWLRSHLKDLFKLTMSKKITFEWFTLYSVCIDTNTNPKYTHHTIDEEIINNRQMKLTKYGENDMKNLLKYPQSQVYMFSMYKKENIWKQFNAKFKGKLNSFFNVENHHFVPVALVPEETMLFSSWRYATHLTMNIVPVWKQVSCTWRNIEKIVKQAALQVGSTLDIYTGISKKLILPTSAEDKAKGTGKPINFGDLLNTFYVPAVLWKLIYHKEKAEAVIFLLHNNPYLTDKPEFRKSCCKNICKKYGWEIENNIIKLGQVYCCDPREFFKNDNEFEGFQKNFEIKDVLKLPDSKLDTESD